MVPHDEPYYVTVVLNTTTVIWHPDDNIDLCAIMLKFAHDAPPGYCWSFDSDWIHETNGDLNAVEKVLMVGYPMGHTYDESTHLPLIRDGITANPPYMLYHGTTWAGALDIGSYPGSSGSPVVILNHFRTSKSTGKPLMGTFKRMLGIFYKYAVAVVIDAKVLFNDGKPRDGNFSVPVHLAYYVKAVKIFDLIPRTRCTQQQLLEDVTIHPVDQRS
jgi:hypothetical protein